MQHVPNLLCIFIIHVLDFVDDRSKGITMDTIYKDWLDCSGMPKALKEDDFIQGNSLIQQVNDVVRS